MCFLYSFITSMSRKKKRNYKISETNFVIFFDITLLVPYKLLFYYFNPYYFGLYDISMLYMYYYLGHLLCTYFFRIEILNLA